ncbi:MAG: 2,4'-dihydroxyacetophenone dioxygenase family protein [Myxococcota bacterium]
MATASESTTVGDPTAAAPLAVHFGAEDLPFVEIGDGSQLKVIQVDRAQGLWVIENVFQNGYQVPTHKHTGPVWGFTVSGAWKYAEYDYVNRAGSMLYEPAGSVHTLQCIEDTTRVWFHMTGSNLNLDAKGEIESVVDGDVTLQAYLALCEAQGFARPNVLISG